MSAPQRRRAAAPSVDIQVQSPLWDSEPAAEETVREAIAAAAKRVPAAGEVSVETCPAHRVMRRMSSRLR